VFSSHEGFAFLRLAEAIFWPFLFAYHPSLRFPHAPSVPQLYSGMLSGLIRLTGAYVTGITGLYVAPRWISADLWASAILYTFRGP